MTLIDKLVIDEQIDCLALTELWYLKMVEHDYDKRIFDYYIGFKPTKLFYQVLAADLHKLKGKRKC